MAVEPEINARRYREGDEEKTVSLLTTIFGKWPRFDLEYDSVDHWKWKYLENPLGKQVVTLVETGDRLIGCHHTNINPAKIGDNIQLISQAMDLGTHPDFRRMGVNKKISELSNELKHLDENTFTYWVTGNPLVMAINRKGGNPNFVHKINSLINIKNVERHFIARGNQGDHLKKTGLKIINQLKRVQNVFIAQKIHEVSEITESDERFNKFGEKMLPEYRFLVQINTDYLNWRYCDPRGGRYKKYMVEHDGAVIGSMVLRVNLMNEGYPEGYIVDLNALNGDEAILNSLIRTGMEYFDAQKINVIHALSVEGGYLEKTFLKNGWIKNPVNIAVSYGTQNIDEKDLELYKAASPDQINFQYGTTDWI